MSVPSVTGAEPHPAEHLAVRLARHQHDGARVVVDVVEVAAGEQPLLVDERLRAAAAVRRDQSPRPVGRLR